MISNRFTAFLAQGIAAHFLLDEINIVFQRSGFYGGEKKHWTRLARTQAWLKELNVNTAELLSGLLMTLLEQKNEKSKPYLSFLHDLSNELENEYLENPFLESQLVHFGLVKNSHAPKIDKNIKKINSTKAAFRGSKKNIALSQEAFKTLQELLQSSTSNVASPNKTNKTILPISEKQFQQLEAEVNAAIALLSAPEKPKRTHDYLKEFRGFLKELKLTVASSTQFAASTMLLLVALEKCIEALQKLIK